MAFSYPSGYNTFVPDFDSSGKLIVEFSRNIKDFPLNKYVSIKPVKKSLGLYLQITAEEAARVLQTDLANHVWPDGADSPSDSWGNESFQFKPYVTQRYEYGFRLGHKSVDQADWDIKTTMANIHAQQAMTARVLKAVTALTTSGNYDAGHSDTVATWSGVAGANLDDGTATVPHFKLALLGAAQQIHKATLGVIQPKDLVFICNPVAARKIASSVELMDAFKQSPFAWSWYTEGKEVVGSEAKWGLPAEYAGIKIVVEDTVRVTSAKGATKASSYVFPDDTALLISRPGSLVSNGGVSFGTGQFFMYEEMTVETRDDPDARRVKGRIIDDWDFQIVAPSSGVILTDILN